MGVSLRFIDDVKIFVKSGDGGNGCVSFLKEKFVPRGGPDGGNGGKGGDVIIVADSQFMNLFDLKHRKHHRAKRGVNGSSKDRHGANADRITVHVPPGTVIYDEDKQNILADLEVEGDQFIAARGGNGGRGNATFVTSTNRAPQKAQEGKPGEEKWLGLELKLIADVGLIGFPSVGKSTMVAAISRAKPKIAAYPFTTLSPNLGTVDRDPQRRFVVADIPGLIEGAHLGVGLGHKFLRHIERTRLLVHMVDLDLQNGRDPVVDYETMNKELGAYDEQLALKPQIIVANKMDVSGAREQFEKFAKYCAGQGIDPHLVSAKDGIGVKELLDHIEVELAKIAEADAQSS